MTRSLLLMLPVLMAAGLPADAQPPAPPPLPRFLAMFTDGSRTTGNGVREWSSPTEKPKLEGGKDLVELLNPGQPLRWLRDQSLEDLETGAEMAGFVEFTLGDRLPGRVFGYLDAAGGESPHLLVTTEARVGPPGQRTAQVRVLPQMVRRVVWGHTARRTLEPGKAFLRDGRQVAFRSLRWQRDGVRVLAEDGIVPLAWSELSEVHLPARDFWREYCAELVVLSPDLHERLWRVETVDGLRVTGSDRVGRPVARNGPGDQSNWYCVVRPAWSLDPLWMSFTAIRVRWYFAPHEVPLSRLAPARFVERPMLSGNWSWKENASVEGGFLRTGQGLHGWGYGVHAPCELWFELPQGAQSFRTQVGLDASVGSGGCARGLVCLDKPENPPLYRSPHLVGSATVADSGNLPLGNAPGHKLILVADAAANDCPAGADPLDVSDHLDWIEPLLQLDAAKLKAEMDRRDVSVCWDGWTANVEGGGRIQRSFAFENVEGPPSAERPPMPSRKPGAPPSDDPLPPLPAAPRSAPPRLLHVPRVTPGITTDGRVLTLAAEQQISETANALLVRVRQTAGGSTGRLEIRVDAKPLARLDLVRFDTLPYCVALDRYLGKKVKLEVVYQPGDKLEQVQWETLRLTGRAAQTLWRAVTMSNQRSFRGVGIIPRQDVVADTYLINTQSDLAKIQAFRLEASPGDVSAGQLLPDGSAAAEFQVGLAVESPLPNPKPVSGRYVRIERSEAAKVPISLAEVQVYSGGGNVAPQGKASQSSSEGQATAQRAVDNNTNGQWNGNTIAQTQSSDAGPWWELDLGTSKPLERIALWLPTEAGLPRASAFRISVLDDKHNQQWQKRVRCCQTTEEMMLAESTEIRVGRRRVAVTDAAGAEGGAAGLDPICWQSAAPGTIFAAEYFPAAPLDVQKQPLVFSVRQSTPQARDLLTVFRIFATADPPPFASGSACIEATLLPP